MSNGRAPVLASYSAIALFTSSMSAVAGSYSRSVVSPWDENASILAFMFGLLRDVHVWSTVGAESGRFGSLHVILHRFRQLSRWIALGAIHCLRKRSLAKPQREQSTCYCRFPFLVQHQYSRHQ